MAYIIRIFAVFFILPFFSLAEEGKKADRQQPKTRKEFLNALQISLQEQPFTYVIIASPERLLPDNICGRKNKQENWYGLPSAPTPMQYIGSRYFGDTIAESSNKTADIRIYAEPQYAKKAFEYCLIPDPPIGTSAAIINMARRYELIPHNRFFAEYKNEVIGNFSYERKFGLWEEDPSNYVCFIRGNCLVICTGYFDFDEKTYLPKRCTGSSDPLETAWRIDLYLKTPPVEKLKTEEKQELKTLNITLLSLTQIDVNKEYVLDFPRRTAKGDTPTEIRLVVSSGEIRQVIDLSSDQNKNSVSPPQDQTQRANGRYTVKFFKSGNQTISCYHIDKDGCCTAWGEQTVRVNKEPACLGLKSAKSTATSVIATTAQ